MANEKPLRMRLVTAKTVTDIELGKAIIEIEPKMTYDELVQNYKNALIDIQAIREILRFDPLSSPYKNALNKLKVIEDIVNLTCERHEGGEQDERIKLEV